MHNRIVIVNSTPVIALAAIDCLYLLKEIYGKVYIPEAVYNEVAAKQGSKAQLEIDGLKDWIQIKKIQNSEAE